MEVGLGRKKGHRPFNRIDSVGQILCFHLFAVVATLHGRCHSTHLTLVQHSRL
jgi:hypothetical protein